MPHMMGGAFPPGLVTLNVSVRHWLAEVTSTVAAPVTIPLIVIPVVTVSVEGPVMVKV